jgi:N-acetylglucosamine kinase-like BadF-type ATPase
MIMPTRYYLGIDGGGTKTRVCIINDKKETIHLETTGPSSIDTVSEATTILAIKEVLTSFHNTYHFFPKFKSVFAGLGGIIDESDSQRIQELLYQLPGVDKDTLIYVKNDIENALACGGIEDEGVVLICGTGSVCFGRDKYGQTHKTGGWGYREGDSGSAYDLGRNALKLAVRSLDGRIESDEFTEEVCKTVEMHESKDILAVMNNYVPNRTKTAELAPLVTKYANLDSDYAYMLVDKATDELQLLVETVFKKLEMSKKQIVIVGSLGNADGVFKSLLHNKIKKINSNIEIISPKTDPAIAAALMATKIKK